MPAFDKNSVQIEHAYTINPIEDEEIQLQACPRCGALAERKHRNTCLSCKRHIPPISARQKWDTRSSRNAFAEISPLVVREKKVKEHRFGLVKKGSWEVVRELRKAIIVVAIGAAVYFAAPHVGLAVLGKAAVKDMQQELGYILGMSPAKSIASTRSSAH